jgi:glycerol-3-phosphate dehydrogenase
VDDRTRLGPAQRERDLHRLGTQVFDVVVVGGGVTGAGAALDAASRGLSVALVEARDWAAGTSSRSSKLVHGGLRYLEQLDLPLVREALVERGLQLRTIAPHLVRPVPFLLPLTAPVWQRAYVGAGVLLYDVLSSTFGTARGVPRHRHLSRRAAVADFPSLHPDRLCGAIRFYDAQVDDARHTLALARTAAAYGCAAVSSARVVDLLRSGSAVTGVRVHCLETGAALDVRSRSVIAATGVWSDDIGRMLGGRTSLRVRASKGVHLVVGRDRIEGSTGLILRTETSVLFVIPWGLHWIIGTTDTDWNLDRAHPAASSADIDYLFEHVNRVLADPLDRSDIEGVYAGLRPLLAGESDATSRLSREHAVVMPVPGLVLVAGGKYTTYRVMAADAVDAATAGLVGTPASRTARLPLVGARSYARVCSGRSLLAQRHEIPLSTVESLLRRYGDRVVELLELIADRPELARPLPGAPDHLAVEVWYAALAEGALHLDDVLTRRTRISVQTPHRGLESADRVCELMGEVLRWPPAVREREIEHYRTRVAAERESQLMPDDRTADAARLGAPDVRAGA